MINLGRKVISGFGSYRHDDLSGIRSGLLTGMDANFLQGLALITL